MEYAEAINWWLAYPIALAFTGGRRNQTGALSLGGTASIFPIYDTDDEALATCVGNTLGNIPTDVASGGGSIYRAFYLRNGTFDTYNPMTFHNIKLFHTQTTSNPLDAVFFGTDSQGILDGGEGNGGFYVTMSSIPNEAYPPTVSSWLGYGETLSIDKLETWQGVVVWFRQSVSAGSSWEVGSMSVRIECDVVREEAV